MATSRILAVIPVAVEVREDGSARVAPLGLLESSLRGYVCPEGVRAGSELALGKAVRRSVIGELKRRREAKNAEQPRPEGPRQPDKGDPP